MKNILEKIIIQKKIDLEDIKKKNSLVNIDKKIKFTNNYLDFKKTLIDKAVLTNVKDSFISDIYAYGTFVNMEKYINFYSNIDSIVNKNGKKKTPETYLYHYLNDNHIAYSKKKN